MRLSIVIAVSLALTTVLIPAAEAIPPVCLEKHVGADPVGTVEVWVTCYPGVWHCEPGERMPECDRLFVLS